MTRPARLTALLLLAVWIGPVTLEQTDGWRLLTWVGAPARAQADPRVIPAGAAVILEPGTPLRLRLRDGSVVEGRLLGRALLDSAGYASRFASFPHAPLALGESLHVVLHDGRSWSARFAGYGHLSLLLRGPEVTPPRRAPFESVREVRRAGGERVEPMHLARAFRGDSLPSAEAIVLAERTREIGMADWWASGLHVAVQDIESAVADLPSRAGAKPGSDGAEIAGVIVLSVVVAVVLVFVILGACVNGARNRGCTHSGPAPRLFGGRLTQRPFDRHRGCFVGDPLAAADPWPALDAGAASMAGAMGEEPAAAIPMR